MADLTRCDRCRRTTVDPDGKRWANVTITVGRGVPDTIMLCDECQEVLAGTLRRVRRTTSQPTQLRAVE